jgi:adenosine deaminase
MMHTVPDLAWFRHLPKVEVHVHLEGCLERDRIVELAAAAGEALPRPPDRLFEFADLGTFLEFLDWSCGLVRTPGEVARIAYDFAERERRSGVGYADVIVNPTHWPAWRDRLGAFIDAMDRGFEEARQEGSPPVGLCISLLRQQTEGEAAELVDLLLELRHPRVVALSIDGNEAAAGRTGPRFAEAFRRAGEGGLHRTVHAGESSGPEGVRDAIDLLGADRVDHGFRAAEDPLLVQELADRRIPLGICPTSNIELGFFEDLADHPLERLRAAGVPISLNTDDPAYVGASVEGEYRKVAEAFGWDVASIGEVARTSVEASFADDDTRSRLNGEIEGWLAAMRKIENP